MTSSPRYDFYQTGSHIILSIYQKALVADHVEVLATERDVEIIYEGESLISLGPLFGPIDPDSMIRKVFGTKIELKLPKSTPGAPWPTLLDPSTSTSSDTPKGSGSGQHATASGFEGDSGQSGLKGSTGHPPGTDLAHASGDGAGGNGFTSNNPSSPLSSAAAPSLDTTGISPSPIRPQGQSALSKKKKDWSKIVQEEESEDKDGKGSDSVESFFQNLYKDLDPDSRRAMMKSYSESGGTTLSTDWKDIGSKKTPIHPPEGLEAKKWTS